jgi:hypothetical protein
MNKKQFLKDIIDGTLTKEQAAYLVELHKSGNCYVFFCATENGELVPEDRDRKAIYDKLPEKYKSMYFAIITDEQFKGI